MANFVSQSQIKTILQRIKAWLTANTVKDMQIGSANTLQYKKPGDETWTNAGTIVIPSAGTSTPGVVQLDSTIPAENLASTTKAPTTKAVASALKNKVDKETTSIKFVSSSDNTKFSTISTAASSDSANFEFPNKPYNSGTAYTIATTADIPASITLDAAPTNNSTNGVQSGGVYTALSSKADLNNSEQDFTADRITASTVSASTSVSAPTVEATNEVVIGGTTLYDNGGTLSIGLPSRDGTIALLSDIATEPAYEIATRDASTGLPDVSSPKHGVIYLVLATNGTNNAYDEYLWVNTTGSTNVWEKIGNTEISLTDYWHHKSGQSSSADYLAEANMGNASDTASTADSASIYAWLNSYFPAS